MTIPTANAKDIADHLTGVLPSSMVEDWIRDDCGPTTLNEEELKLLRSGIFWAAADKIVRYLVEGEYVTLPKMQHTN